MYKNLCWCLLLAVSCNGFADINQQAVIQQLTAAQQSNRPAVVLSAQLGDYSEAQAYQIQTAWVQQRLAGKPAYGFKAGLTSQAGQQKFAVDGPVAGVLLAPLQDPTLMTVSQQHYHRMMLEMELGFRLKRAITKPVTVTELQNNIAQVVAVIELPDLGFDQPQQLSGVDIIASNVAAKHLLIGQAMPFDQLAVNDLQLSLHFNGKHLLQAEAKQVMGDQVKALHWLVHRMLANGWSIQPEQLLITGAIGKMLPAAPGEYTAHFADLGVLQFTITE